MTGDDDGKPPADPDKGPDRVKAAMGRKRQVKAGLRVIDGGKPAAAPRRSRKAKASASPAFDPSVVPGGKARPKAAGDDDGGEPSEDESTEDGAGEDFERRPDGIDEDAWDAARRCTGLDQNDRHNAHRLIIHFGQNLIYVPGPGWLTWRDTHWQRDEGELGARLLAQDVVDRIKLECFHIDATPDQTRVIEAARRYRRLPEPTRPQQSTMMLADRILDELSKRRSKRRAFAVSTGNSGRTSGMLEQAKSLKVTDQDRLDADHLLFNVKNGTLHFWREPDHEQDLTPEADGTPIVQRLVGRFELKPHNRNDFITKLADVEHVEGATCPRFMAFLEKMQPKPVMRLFLQVFHGYALMTGGNGAQKLVFHFGTGANGKSAFIEATGRLAGSYRAVVSPDTITGDGQRQGQQASPDIARLFNTRYVTVEELPKNVPLKEELIKAVSGGTKLTARFNYGDNFEFLPIFTAVLSGNNKPQIIGSDHGIWRRVLLVLWGVTITEAERLEFDELMALFDAERSGILNWLIDGTLLYLAKGLAPFIPPEVTAFTEDYRQDRDNVGVFARVGIERAPGEVIQAGRLYKAYTDWCEVNGLNAAKQRTFGDRLADLGFEKITGRLYVYQDVRLTDAASVKYEATAEPGF